MSNTPADDDAPEFEKIVGALLKVNPTGLSGKHRRGVDRPYVVTFMDSPDEGPAWSGDTEEAAREFVGREADGRPWIIWKAEGGGMMAQVDRGGG